MSQTNRRMNNEQKYGVNNVPPHKNIKEHNEKCDTHTGTRYGRTVWKQDKQTY